MVVWLQPMKFMNLLTKIHDILDNAVSTCISNMACVLGYLFNSASRQCREVWASQLPFLYNIKDSVPPNEACLYRQINWSLAQVHHQSSLGLFQYSSSMRGSRAKPKAGFQLNVEEWSVPESSSASLAKKPCLGTKPESHQSGKNQLGGVSTLLLTLKRGGLMEDGIPDVLQSLDLSSYLLCRLVLFPNFKSVEKHYFQ